jgi:hypothetical protein
MSTTTRFDLYTADGRWPYRNLDCQGVLRALWAAWNQTQGIRFDDDDVPHLLRFEANGLTVVERESTTPIEPKGAQP